MKYLREFSTELFITIAMVLFFVTVSFFSSAQTSDNYLKLKGKVDHSEVVEVMLIQGEKIREMKIKSKFTLKLSPEESAVVVFRTECKEKFLTISKGESGTYLLNLIVDFSTQENALLSYNSGYYWFKREL